MKLYTIGVEKKSAEDFFQVLARAQVEKVLDVRLNNKSQLLGFSKGRDLNYFLEKCHQIKYEHIPQMAPSKDLLKKYRADQDWTAYENSFREIMNSRPVAEIFLKACEGLNSVCLLCTEANPEQCHRRLAAEYLAGKLEGIQIVHL